MSTFQTRLGPSCTTHEFTRVIISHESLLELSQSTFWNREEDSGLQNLLLPLLNTTAIIIPTYPLRSRVYRKEIKMSFFDPFSHFSWIPMISRDYPGLKAQIDWIETSNNHIFKINVPGLSRDEIKVQLEEGNVLQISSVGAKEESSPKEAIWHIVGRGKGDFSRQIVLPENVKADQIKAQVENGVLTIVVPKDASNKSRSRNIPISSKL